MSKDTLPEICMECEEFSHLEILSITEYQEGIPKEYHCECTLCHHIDVYAEDFDDFAQAMNDLRPEDEYNKTR